MGHACSAPCRQSDGGRDESLRVVIAEDHYLVREGARQLLEASDEVQVVAAVGTRDELLDAVARLQPDAVMTDIRMPPTHQMEGIEAAHTIRARHPQIGVVVLSQYADDVYALELLKHGTDGLAYLLKERVGDRGELLRALRETAARRSVIDPVVVESLVGRRARQSRSRLRDLNQREMDVLAQMAQGKTNQAIAEALSISESAVEKNINSIFSKLGVSEESQVHRRVAAVLTFLRESDLG